MVRLNLLSEVLYVPFILPRLASSVTRLISLIPTLRLMTIDNKNKITELKEVISLSINEAINSVSNEVMLM